MEIGPLVPENKILRVINIYGRVGLLGHVANIILNNFRFLVHESLHINLVHNCFCEKQVLILIFKGPLV